MSLRIIEGWNNYPAAQLSTFVGNLWTNQNGIESEVSTLAPRNGRACLRLLTVGRRAIRSLGAAPTTRIIVGFAAKVTSVGSPQSADFIGISDGTNANSLGVCVTVADGSVGVRRNGAIIATSAFKTGINTYHYYVLDIDIVANTLDLWADRVKVLNAIPFASIAGWAVKVACVGTFCSNTTSVDDVFFAVDSDATERAALIAAADFVVVDAVPSANRVLQDWTFTGGASAFECINNQPYNTAEFIEAGTVGDVSEFDYSNVSAGVFQVYGAQHYYYAQKSDAGAGSMQASINGSAGVDNALAQTWGYFTDLYPTNPLTGLPWAPADLATVISAMTRTA